MIFAASSHETLRSTIRRDWNANPRDPKARFVLIWFRIARAAWLNPLMPRVIKYGVAALYRVMTECFLGIEMRPKASVGPGLRLYHGFGIVINNDAVIGEDVVLRHGVTLGHTHPGGPCPIVEDRVEFGALAVALGGIRIGSDSLIGAGAVVLKDVPAYSVVAGNPARVVSRRDPDRP